MKQDELATAIVGWLNRSFAIDELKYLACGVADFGDNMLFSKMEMVNLSAAEHSLIYFLYRFVLGTPLLKTHIDRLHAIHILPRKPLSQIARRLGLPKPLRIGKDLAALAIPKKMIETPDSNLRVAKFAILRDDSTSWAGVVKRGGQVSAK